MRKIVVTTDHEIFGNGTGDVRQHVIEPTERMCRIGEKYGVPVTIFFEVEEFLSFREHATELKKVWGYDGAAEMEQQARELSERGHDIQLHIHPQWYEATRTGGEWQLQMENLTVDSLFAHGDEAVSYLAKRKAELEYISGKAVTCYRAGGFAAQPGQMLLRGLKENGFVLDSSVVKGLKRTKPCPLDFDNAPRGRMWKIFDDVIREDPEGGLWEVPIHSVMKRRYNQLTPERLIAKFSGNVPKAQQKAMVEQLGIGKNPVKIAKFLVQRVPIKMDYHNLTPKALRRMIHEAPAPRAGEPDVLVLIGHSKEHVDDAKFERFCQMVDAEPDVEAVTMNDVAEMLSTKKNAVEKEPLATAVGA